MSTERTTAQAHARNLRKGRCNEVSRAYHITTTTLAREPVFRDLYLARRLIQCLRQSDINGDTQTFAFVVMPDHLHCRTPDLALNSMRLDRLKNEA